MDNSINLARAKFAAAELFEGLVALQHDKKYPQIHRETVEQNFTDLARELGFAVYPLSDDASGVRGASLNEGTRNV